MVSMNPKSLSERGRQFFRLIEFDSDEQLVGEIRKHPFGLFVIYASGMIVALVMMIVLIIIPSLLTTDSFGTGLDIGALRSILVVAGFFLVLLCIIMTAIAAYLYNSNVVIITSEKVTQMLYKTIFDRKISQLSIGDVQDVTVSQVGVFSRVFNYGTLTIETAGEQQNYMFTYTPNPYETAKLIVGSHEENLKKYGN